MIPGIRGELFKAAPKATSASDLEAHLFSFREDPAAVVTARRSALMLAKPPSVARQRLWRSEFQFSEDTRFQMIAAGTRLHPELLISGGLTTLASGGQNAILDLVIRWPK